MIFLAGIHGVGKTTMCGLIKGNLGVNFYTASKMIENKLSFTLPWDKQIDDINYFQNILIDETDQIDENIFILEGHLCLINQNGEIVRIPQKYFELLKPEILIILTEAAPKIAGRNRERGKLLSSESFVRVFQEQEILYGMYLEEQLKVPVMIVKNDQMGYDKVAGYIMEKKDGLNHTIN